MPPSPIRRTKIVATLGPSWSSPEKVAALLHAGVNVVRVNASHGTPEIAPRVDQHGEAGASGTGNPAALLFDLQGPRIRVGDLADPLRLEPGSRVVFAPEESTKPARSRPPMPPSPRTFGSAPGSCSTTGCSRWTSLAIDGDRVVGAVRYGGELKSHKGMNLPGIEVSAPALTEKDREDVDRGGGARRRLHRALVRAAAGDLDELRRLVPKRVRIVAKIEKDTALRNLCGILEASDAIMVARGDLGVELPFEEVPLMQKRIIREANLHGKPVITATQMLESMIHAPIPTRAEASDVANAILDGTDAVMLSAETAVGEYPLEAVRAMDRIAREMESHRGGRSPALDAAVGRRSPETTWTRCTPSRRCRQARLAPRTPSASRSCAAAELLHCPLIVCFTSSGFTARKVATYRPTVPIFAATPEPETFQQLSLVWGAIPALTAHSTDYDSLLREARQAILAARPGAARRTAGGHRRRAVRRAGHYQPPEDRSL